ncbi:hypothetical protein I7I51_00896 [Histoplasma capsulatum]|uniref:Uncharacterized protein n=1 Tax=Ajellomyces capsulatus TaxID=5037 RepID=A0A8A1MBH6_AJECA|nr:hypothetical protein I7I51_00896 [Histoplasma capsulatum]
MDVILALETIAERVGVTVIRRSSSASYQQVHTATRSFHSSPTPINNELLPQTTGTRDNAYEEGLIRSVSVVPGSVQQPSAPNSISEEENSVPEDETQPTAGVVLSKTCSSNSNSSPSPRAQRLLQKIKEKLNDICQFSKHSPHNIVEGFFENLRSEDCRLGHIKSITGKHTPEPKERFIQCLAQRSLALDFHQWESNLQQAGSTRLDNVSRIPSSARNKNGNFRHYVERVARFIDTETAYIALKRGTKQLAVENDAGKINDVAPKAPNPARLPTQPDAVVWFHNAVSLKKLDRYPLGEAPPENAVKCKILKTHRHLTFIPLKWTIQIQQPSMAPMGTCLNSKQGIPRVRASLADWILWQMLRPTYLILKRQGI